MSEKTQENADTAICYCGHVRDEHGHSRGACAVVGCACICFDHDPDGGAMSDENEKANEAVYHVDPQRFGVVVNTGILVRALHSDHRLHAADISELTRGSLMDWLRSRGGSNPWAEQTVAILLGWE